MDDSKNQGMKKFACVLFFFMIRTLPAFSQLQVLSTRVENRINPIGLDQEHPRFSWQLSCRQRGQQQRAYQIRVMIKNGKTEIWNSGKELSASSVFVPYLGETLLSGGVYFWQVRVWDQDGKVSPWSSTAYWQMGLLGQKDWKAKWIESVSPADSVNGPALLFRKKFIADKKILSATVFITVHGMYEAFLNGKKIGDAFLTPGWTSYPKRLQYQVYDVTPWLVKGNNVLGVDMGSGWYRTNLGWNDNKNVYGKKLGLLLQLEIQYTDGSRQTVISDGSWKTTDEGPIRSSEIYQGEFYDARREIGAWDSASFDDHAWTGVVESTYPMGNLVATYNEPVTMHEKFNPVRVFTSPRGEDLIDFGQNLVGWEEIVVQGNAGDSVIVDHAEVLDKAGNFYTENLRDAKAENVYILKGNGEELLRPHFTFQGFRYIRLRRTYKGNGKVVPPGELSRISGQVHSLISVDAVTLYSNMEPTGEFSCSNPLLNQLQHNIQWGQKGNFLDVPTDCPQRDERLGWTGDAQAFSRTASFNMGVHNFFAKWLQDVAADQTQDGMVPFVVPNVLGPKAGGSAGWADVSTIIPWNMWLAYGDINILEDQYTSMKAWVGFMLAHSRNYLWNEGFHFGDWLFYRPADDNDGRSAVTDKYLIAQCFFAHSTELLIKAATVLHKTQDIKQYQDLLKGIKQAFVKEYVTASGRMVSGTQTAYVLALQFDMLPDSLRPQAAARLVVNVHDYNNHLTTGFLGTPYLCEVLTRFGYDSLAYTLLLQDTYPSWLYPVKMGATTIWERWDGQKPDSSFQTPSMNSFNHYAYGAIGDWMYRTITGMDTYEEGPGYKKIRIWPHPGGQLSYANADLETVYGKLSSHWKIEGGQFLLDVDIPVNTSATIYIPVSSGGPVLENGIPIERVKEIAIVRKEGKYLLLQTGSGVYHFSTVGP
jgi:alpha-L-rhamnosidase